MAMRSRKWRRARIAPRARVVVWIASGIFGAAAARAAPPARLRIAGDGACPSTASVVRELPRLLPEVTLSTTREAPTPADAVVEEIKNGFAVTIDGQRRDFDDPTYRCSERAQLAAVFIAIVLDPPRFARLSESAPLLRESTPHVAAERAPLDFELGPELQAAPGAGLATLPIASGAGARMRWGRAVSLSCGAGALTSMSLDYDAAGARALWLPLDVGARLALSSVRWDGGAEISLVLAPLYLRGRDIEVPESTWRTEGGVRAALFTRYWAASRAGIFLSAYGVLFPRPYTLGVSGVGDIGKTPSFWLGAQLGVAMRAN